MKVDAGMAQRPPMHRRGSVRREDAEHDVDLSRRLDVSIRSREERPRSPAPDAGVGIGRHLAGRHIERREQIQRAVAQVLCVRRSGWPRSIGRIGGARCSAWICDFSSTAKTTAFAGGGHVQAHHWSHEGCRPSCGTLRAPAACEHTVVATRDAVDPDLSVLIESLPADRRLLLCVRRRRLSAGPHVRLRHPRLAAFCQCIRYVRGNADGRGRRKVGEAIEAWARAEQIVDASTSVTRRSLVAHERRHRHPVRHD